MNIFISDRYTAVLLLRRFGREMPIPAHFGEVFWGFDPQNVVGYCDLKRHILGRKHAFWRIDRADGSRNVTWARAEESKKRRETQRCDKSHICPDHPRCATPCTTPTKVVVWVLSQM